jgi:F420-non-reducing hydrogenase small subunit
MTTKPKIALYWCSGCGGCEESVIDMAEDILKIADAADIVFWPVALDFKYEDVEKMADGEIAATLINGAIRLDNQEHEAKLLRRKSRFIIAHGSCAHLGGVVGLANFSAKKEIFKRVYREVPSVLNTQGILPESLTLESGKEMELPAFHDTVKALNQVIEVDYYIPGCPPVPDQIRDAVLAVVNGDLPPDGHVFADIKALCNTCSRNASKPDKLQIKEFRRLYDSEWDPEKCFLPQGIICLGLATRGGCGERCIKANMPCRGCFGPPGNVVDQGAKFLSAIASLMEPYESSEIERLAASIPDPAGLFYRYSLASSIMRGRISE